MRTREGSGLGGREEKQNSEILAGYSLKVCGIYMCLWDLGVDVCCFSALRVCGGMVLWFDAWCDGRLYRCVLGGSLG